ncbi:MAG: TetR/AcrR family transcriptional regulator [Balneolaceae bacterium]
MDKLSDKKRAIFDSTLELVRDHGFHGTTMNQVAKNASVAAGTIYHYFDSKDQLVCELYHYNRDLVIRVIEEAIEEQSSCKENYSNIWSSLYRFYVRNTDTLIFFEQFINSPYNTNKDHAHYQGPLYQFFKTGSEKGQLKSIKPEIAIVLTMSSIASTAKLNKFGKISLSDHDLENIVDILWDGIARH